MVIGKLPLLLYGRQNGYLYENRSKGTHMVIGNLPLLLYGMEEKMGIYMTVGQRVPIW